MVALGPLDISHPPLCCVTCLADVWCSGGHSTKGQWCPMRFYNMSQTIDERLLLNQFSASRASVPRTPSITRFDVETRSMLDLKKVDAWVYSLHPSTELLVMCWAVDGGPVHNFTP